MGFTTQLLKALRTVATDLQGNGVAAGPIQSAIVAAVNGEADSQIERAVTRIRGEADRFHAGCVQGILPGFDPHTTDAPAGRFARSRTLRNRPAPAPESHCVQCGGRFGFGPDRCRCPFPAPAPAPADAWEGNGPVS